MRTRLFWAVLLTASIAVATTSWGQEGEEPGEVEGEVILHGPEEGTVFGYGGEIGPESWGQLDSDWRLCDEGEMQTPIDLRARDVRLIFSEGGLKSALREKGGWDVDTLGAAPDLDFDYHESEIAVINNGHTVQFNYDPGSRLRIEPDREFELAQFHFHTPSEHTFEGGAHFPIEMHLVHEDAEENLAVVGVMIREGQENESLPAERLAQLLPGAEGVEYRLGAGINVEELIPENHRAYFYFGSLTTPPCSERVFWIVIQEPLEMSKEQIDILRGVLNRLAFAGENGQSNRPTQPLNGRRVFLDVF